MLNLKRYPADTLTDVYNFSIANNGPIFYFRTNHNAPFFKVVSVDISKPRSEREWKEVFPENEDANLERVLAVGEDKLAVVYKRNVCLRFRNLQPLN